MIASTASPLPFLAALLIAVGAGAQDRNVSGGRLIPEQACYDVLRYDLAIEVDPEQRHIDGRLTMRARIVAPTLRLALDLDPALEVGDCLLDGAAVEHEHDAGRLWITAPAELGAGQVIEVTVGYGGAPRVAPRPPWQGGFTWSKTAAGEHWIATSCQGEGADLWWPCKDHPSDKPEGMDLRVTVPEGLVVACNGTEHTEPVTDKGQTTFHWRVDSPFSNYVIALNIAPYVELRDTYTCIDGTKMPIRFFVLPESERKAKRCMAQFLDHLRVFEELLGPYPFRHEKYGIAETPHLGMEHQTIIAYGNGFGDEEYDWLHNHELAHEWWGNLVTCRDWKDMWIHEGFGTYMQPLYRERRFGREAYDQEMQRHGTMNRGPVAPRESKSSFEIYFGPGGSNDIYYKGKWILHTLRWQLGDEKFFTCLRRFCYPTPAHEQATDGSQVRLVDTEDFIALVNEIAGEDLHWFFEIYLRQPHLPKLVSKREGDVLELRWSTPRDLQFEVPVPIVVGGTEHVVEMKGNRGEIAVGDADYLIDPDQRVLMVRPRQQR